MTALQRIVVTWLTTAQGGAEKSSIELCRTIRRRYRLDVDLIFWHYGEDQLDFAIDVAADDNDRGQTICCCDADSYRSRVAEALSHSATVLFSNHRTYSVDLPIADRHGVPTAVIFRQTPMPDEAMRTLSSDSSALAYRRGDELDWAMLRDAAALVGVSDFGARGISRFAGNHPRVVRIHNGVHMPGAGKQRVAPELVRRFLIVARLIDWKAIDFGIEAFARIRELYPDARLQIAGDGEEHGRLQQLTEQLQIDDSVEFLGFVSDIRRVYLDSDCLLHASGIESFGRVVVEASLCGLLVVVPQSAGTGELVVNNHSGLTFDPNNLDDCVRAMKTACQMGPANYERLSTTAQQRSVAMFNTDRLADEYVGLANSLIRPAGKAS